MLLPRAAAGIGGQGILAGLAAESDVLLVGLGEIGAFQAFANAALEVIHGREIAGGGGFIEEQGQGFAAAFQAAVEFGIGFDKALGLQIGAAEVEAADPGIQRGLASVNSLMAARGSPAASRMSPSRILP